MNSLRLCRRLLLPSLALALASCDDQAPLGSAASPTAPQFAASTAYTPLECPTDVKKEGSLNIGSLGGELVVDGHKLTVPAGAVLTPTEFKLTVPASNYVEVKVTAGDTEHFQFREPVSLTISYARCTRSNLEKKQFRIFYWNSATKTYIEEMPVGTHNSGEKWVSTSTDHLSDYVIGTN